MGKLYMMEAESATLKAATQVQSQELIEDDAESVDSSPGPAAYQKPLDLNLIGKDFTDSKRKNMPHYTLRPKVDQKAKRLLKDENGNLIEIIEPSR